MNIVWERNRSRAFLWIEGKNYPLTIESRGFAFLAVSKCWKSKLLSGNSLKDIKDELGNHENVDTTIELIYSPKYVRYLYRCGTSKETSQVELKLLSQNVIWTSTNENKSLMNHATVLCLCVGVGRVTTNFWISSSAEDLFHFLHWKCRKTKSSECHNEACVSTIIIQNKICRKLQCR